MKRFFTFSLSLFLFSINLQAQYFEMGGLVGISNYAGDLQFNPMQTTESNLALGIFGRYNFNENISFKVHYYQGTISGNDQNSADGHQNRNLHFQSTIKEIGFQTEYNLIPQSAEITDRMNAYAFLGIAGFAFNPQAMYNGQWTDLQPLGTEGQGMVDHPDRQPYKLRQISIPMGIGMKIFTSDYTNFGLEMGMRKTFTDYLDDVSTNYPDLNTLAEENPTAAALSYRGDAAKLDKMSGAKRGSAASKDWYFFSGVTFSVNIFGYSTGNNNRYRGLF